MFRMDRQTGQFNSGKGNCARSSASKIESLNHRITESFQEWSNDQCLNDSIVLVSSRDRCGRQRGRLCDDLSCSLSYRRVQRLLCAIDDFGDDVRGIVLRPYYRFRQARAE
jgi:hypothetical protein